MKIALYVIGKTGAGWLRDGIDVYLKRLPHYVPFELKMLPDLKSTRGLSEAQQKLREGEMLLEALQPSDIVVLLDERGKQFSSREFAGYIERKQTSGARTLVFVVGGPYGFSEAVYARADDKISFSKMTFSHEMIRLIFVEQLYRAMTILKGEPYHHD